MGLMDQLGQAVGGAMGGQTAQNPLLQALTSFLGQNSSAGGLAGIVQAFQKNGLGDIVNSWVSTGKNLPVTPDQISRAWGAIYLSQFAGKAGVSADAASTQLSSLLPDVIDKVTPNGKVESGGIDQLLKMFPGINGSVVFRQIDKKMRLSYGRIFLVTFSKPVHCGRAQKTIHVTDSRVCGRVKRCLPAGLNCIAMSDANPMRLPCIVERGLLAHQLGFPFLSAPRTDNLHRLIPMIVV